MKLILASTSPFRRQLLERLKVSFECHSPDVNEDEYKTSLPPIELAKKLSAAKALDVLKRFPEAIVIGGDQVLDFNGEIFSKPGNKENAFKQLRKLQGQVHILRTGVWIGNKDQHFETVIDAHMSMRPLTDSQIENYLDKDRPFQSCGSYKLEELGSILFERIDCPDQTAIVGLPLSFTYQCLDQLGLKIL